ncbi:hypothetical protein SAMN05216579_1290 [Pseudomonas granadensis]|nr:hypothetical protein SAMN05216579_1290 [Pseudomonas granadensis]
MDRETVGRMCLGESYREQAHSYRGIVAFRHFVSDANPM